MWKLSTLPGKTRLSGRNAGAAADASAISPGHEFSELAASASPAPSGSAELLPSVGRIMASRHTAPRVYILSGGVNFSRGCQRRWKLFTAAEGAAGYATLARVWQPSRLRCEIGEPAATNKTRADVFFLEFSFFFCAFFLAWAFSCLRDWLAELHGGPGGSAWLGTAHVAELIGGAGVLLGACVAPKFRAGRQQPSAQPAPQPRPAPRSRIRPSCGAGCAAQYEFFEASPCKPRSAIGERIEAVTFLGLLSHGPRSAMLTDRIELQTIFLPSGKISRWYIQERVPHGCSLSFFTISEMKCY